MSLAASQKAKSRLAQAEPQTPTVKLAHQPESTKSAHDFVSNTENSHPSHRHKKTNAPQLLGTDFLKARTRYLVLLVLGLGATVYLVYLLTTVQPDTIANIGFYHSYLPLLITLFFVVFFIGSFFLLHTRRAALIALGAVLLLFLKLQAVMLTLPVIASIIGGLFLIEGVMFFIFKK